MLPAFFLALFSFASLSFAQSSSDDQAPPPGDYDEPHVTYVSEPDGIESTPSAPVRGQAQPKQAAPAESPAAARDDSRPSADDPGQISMKDVRLEWSSAVENFIASHSVGDAWAVRDRRGRTWRLRLQKAREQTVRQIAPGSYAGIAALRSVRPASHRLDMEFTVDFTSEGWIVRQYRIEKIDGRR